MTKKEKIYLAIGILFLVIIFISSSMTYQQQSIVHQINFKPTWLVSFLDKLNFVYDGTPHSIQIDGYAKFVEFLLRKAAHFMSYFVLGASLYFGLRNQIKLRYLAGILFWLATIGLAALDEFHQAITGGRTASVVDVMLDGLGALVGILVVFLVSLLIKKIKQRKVTKQTS